MTARLVGIGTDYLQTLSLSCAANDPFQVVVDGSGKSAKID
jgi:hypothetical protein